MSRSFDIDDAGVRIRYGGADAALVLKREISLPLHALDGVSVGLEDAPSPWTPLRVGLSDPVTGTRRGRFWAGGRRFFLDLRRPDRALVLRVKPGYDFDVVAIETDHPESLAEAIRARVSD